MKLGGLKIKIPFLHDIIQHQINFVVASGVAGLFCTRGQNMKSVPPCTSVIFTCTCI